MSVACVFASDPAELARAAAPGCRTCAAGQHPGPRQPQRRLRCGKTGDPDRNVVPNKCYRVGRAADSVRGGCRQVSTGRPRAVEPLSADRAPAGVRES